MVARKLPVLLILAHRTGSSGPANYFGVADSSGTDISSSGGGGPSPAAGGGEGGSHGKRLPRKSSTFRTYVNNEPSVKMMALAHFSVESTSLMIAKIFGVASAPEALVRKGRAEGRGGGGLGSGPPDLHSRTLVCFYKCDISSTHYTDERATDPPACALCARRAWSCTTSPAAPPCSSRRYATS